ncbi:membrane hypothetical protein [Azospirillaceae bacterium]
MSRLRFAILRLIVLFIALSFPLALAVAISGSTPASLRIADLEAWSPIRSAGPATNTLARGISTLAVGSADKASAPDWFNAEDQGLLSEAKAALQRGRLRESLGYLMILSGRLEERQKTLDDFLPIVMPDLTSWIVANYFASALLGALLVILVGLICLPWLIRRLYDFIKLLSSVAIGGATVVGAATLCLALAGQRTLVFAMIEYLSFAGALLFVGNTLLYVANHRARIRNARLAPPPETVRVITVTPIETTPDETSDNAPDSLPALPAPPSRSKRRKLVEALRAEPLNKTVE